MLQRRALSRWLEEWMVHMTLAVCPVVDRVPETSGREAGVAMGGEGTGLGGKTEEHFLSVGQIRLLRPGGKVLEQMRPVYVVLLKREKDAAWLVAPFGRFSNPAVRGEWLTGIRAAPLRVLCLWNARIVAEETVLRAAWLCSMLTADQFARGMEVWRHIREGAPLEHVPARRVGPPLLHPLDPRHGYLQEECELLDQYPGFVNTEEVRHSTLFYDAPSSELRKAAEERGKYGKEGED
jgi:hypothetical protein